MVRRKHRSLMPGNHPLRMFSLNAMEGASNVALAQLMIAESTAPKKYHLCRGGVCCKNQCGQHQLRGPFQASRRTGRDRPAVAE